VLYLVRHAHAHWNLDDDRPLSPAGQEAAGRVAEVLASRPLTMPDIIRLEVESDEIEGWERVWAESR